MGDTVYYDLPYPASTDKVSLGYKNIQSLAEQIDDILFTAGLPIVGNAATVLRTDTTFGSAVTGTYNNLVLNTSVALPDGMTATTQAQSDNSTLVATTAYVDAYVAGTVPDGSIGTAELADGAVTNVKVNASAAISYSKLDLTGSIIEADLAFSLATQAELDAHEADTTSVHGISDTANLVYTVDARLTDPRTPTGAAGGVLAGTYPNPSFASDMATQAELDTHEGLTTSVHGIADTSVLATDTSVSTAVSTHASVTTSVHGITDTSVLATATDVSTAVSNHSSDTTSVHGITDTANLVLTGDARLSDARTPTSHAGTHVPGGSDAIDLTKITAIATTLPTLPDALYPAGALIGIGAVAPYLLYRSAGSAWDQIGGAGGGGSIEISDTAPATPDEGNLWFDSTTGKTFIWYVDGSSDQWVEVGEASSLAIPSHGVEHVRGGSDVIDGDRVSVDYVPTNYTRNAAASGAGDVTDLTAHLSGIDLFLPAGMLMPYAGSTEPTGWVFCYGQTVNSVSNTAYARLWTAIGTTYGGASASSFILPDLRGRSLAGKDDMGGTAASRITSGGSGIVGTTLGAAGGTQTHVLTEAQLASHTHTPQFTAYDLTIGGGGYYSSAGQAILAARQGWGTVPPTYTNNVSLFQANANTGSGTAHNNTQPTIITNYLIKL